MSARGEGVILIGDEEEREEVRVLFTNYALAQAEKQIGRGIISVLNEFYGGGGSIGNIAEMLRAGMEAARRDARESGKPVSQRQAYNVLEKAGFSAVAVVVVEAIAAVLSYGTGDEPDDDEPDDDADPN